MSHPKLTFTQRRLLLLKRTLSIACDGVLNIVRKSPVDECEWQVDLSIVNPETKSRKSYSRFWMSLVIGSVVGMFIVLASYKFDRGGYSGVADFVKGFLAYAGGFIFSLILFLRSRCDYTYFIYDTENEPFAFSLYTDKPNKQEFNSFIKDIQNEIRSARINGKKQDYEQIKGAIEFLHKDRVINDHVSALLQYRLSDMNYFSNE